MYLEEEERLIRNTFFWFGYDSSYTLFILNFLVSLFDIFTADFFQSISKPVSFSKLRINVSASKSEEVNESKIAST